MRDEILIMIGKIIFDSEMRKVPDWYMNLFSKDKDTSSENKKEEKK